jgi:hypothetical protein
MPMGVKLLAIKAKLRSNFWVAATLYRMTDRAAWNCRPGETIATKPIQTWYSCCRVVSKNGRCSRE